MGQVNDDAFDAVRKRVAAKFLVGDILVALSCGLSMVSVTCAVLSLLGYG